MASTRRTSKKARRPPAAGNWRRDLTREKLVRAGLGLLDREGCDAVTMRRLAGQVGVTPMALYNHFSSKRDLLRAIAEHAIRGTEFDGGHTDWREQIRHCFHTLRGLCLEHPGLPRLLEIEGVAPASVFAPMEVTLGALGQAGLEPLDGLRTYFLLVSFTLGQASYETSGPFPDLDPSERIRSEGLPGRSYHTTERLERPQTWDFKAAFDFGLTLVLSGVAALGKPDAR
jgi:TetR/AcrR family tetracycline transcriptional repressor